MEFIRTTLKGIVLLVSFFLLSTSVAHAALYQGEVELTYTSSLPSGFVISITDALFPTGHGIFTSCQADGGDIQVFQGAARLPIELVTYDQGSESLLMFTRLASGLATGETLTLQCGSDTGVLSQPGVSEPYGRNAVWQDYAFVTHDFVTDSTGTHSITNTGGMSQSGPNGLKARGYAATYGTGSTDKSVTTYTTNAAVRTIQSFVYQHGYGGGSLGRWYDKGNAIDQVFVRPGVEHGFGYQRGFSGGLGDWHQLNAPLVPTTDAWDLIYLTHDATSDANDPVFYQNAAVNTWEHEGAFSGTLSDNATALTWGNRNSDDARVWDGMLAEARIRESILDAAWVAAEYANFTSPTSFASASALTLLDVTAPTISSVTTSGVTGTSVVVTWTTDEDASTQVWYGLTTAYDMSTAEADTAPRVMSHEQTLTGLVTCTTYHYAVVSKDAPGNTATSSDATFTTTDCPVPAPAPSPSSNESSGGGGGGGSSTLPWCSGPQSPGWDSNIPGGGCGAPQPIVEQAMTSDAPVAPTPTEESFTTVATSPVTPVTLETPTVVPVATQPTTPNPTPTATTPTTLLATAQQELTSTPSEPVMRSLLNTILSFLKRWYQSTLATHFPS